jgi:hypothetical protein
MKRSRLLLSALSLLGILALACGFSAGGGSDTNDDQAANLAATQAALAETQQAIVDQQSSPTEAPQEPSGDDSAGGDTSSEDEPYYVEEFDGDLDSWSYYLLSGEDADLDLYTDGGRLVFDISGEYVWTYLTYDSYTYNDVRIDFRAENLGSNNNNVSLICRYNDRGWYEMNVANNGLYWIYRYTIDDDNFHELYSGGVANLKTGKDTNDFTMICDGERLTLGINGVEVRTIEDSMFDEGLAGIGVSSFDFTPVLVEFDYVEISEP